MDCLHLGGLRCYGYTGALPEEQVLGQWFEVDLKLWLDLALAGASDSLADTLDYREVINEVQILIQTEKFNLIERLADAIATQTLTHKKIQQVQVRLTKVTPPIPNYTGNITVELMRSQPDAL
ncbi:Dihydroneopterin aldolase [Acaryochloris thomasi RCC1774]|uniref:7,8-dihydroneopterin aldolase n=1 Tax=Acaryochloris thomasi RCC1774 TaxID=1764569 RepID=A0A2W1K6Z5_9CYAN|nr:dihydroneopterin aldolase [Acaryochloris thomasi]PZD75441.1 Dihydroneopterin aldolase [Acaryochloris thomasi RCC1774]